MRRINFDTQLLRSFMTVVDTGSFVAAADRLNMTQPAMSQQMRRLEEQLAIPLFRREGRKLSLTNSGDILLGYARKIIELNDEIGEELNNDRQTEIVHIGMPEHFSESLLPLLIADTHKRFPNIQLVVKVARSQTLNEGLAEGRLNLALLLGEPVSVQDTTSQIVPLQWLRSTSFDINDMIDPVPLVLFRLPCGFRKIATTALETAGIRWKCVHEGEDLATLRAAVLANIGITALPVVRDYAGMEVVEHNNSLPQLPDVAFKMKRHARWESRHADGLSALVERLWQDFNSVSAALAS